MIKTILTLLFCALSAVCMASNETGYEKLDESEQPAYNRQNADQIKAASSEEQILRRTAVLLQSFNVDPDYIAEINRKADRLKVPNSEAGATPENKDKELETYQKLLAQQAKFWGINPDELAKEGKTYHKVSEETASLRTLPDNQINIDYRKTKETDSTDDYIRHIVQAVVAIIPFLAIFILIKTRDKQRLTASYIARDSILIGSIMLILWLGEQHGVLKHIYHPLVIAALTSAFAYFVAFAINGYTKLSETSRMQIFLTVAGISTSYWLIMYAMDIADGYGSGNVMVTLFGLGIAIAVAITRKIRVTQ